MTRLANMVTVEPEDSMLAAVKKITDSGVDALPVVKKQSTGKLKLLGKVTKTTLARLLVELSG